MITDASPLSEVTAEAIRVLCREIGVVNTVRFVNQFSTGYGNYTEERRQLFGSMTLDQIIAQIKKDRNQPKE